MDKILFQIVEMINKEIDLFLEGKANIAGEYYYDDICGLKLYDIRISEVVEDIIVAIYFYNGRKQKVIIEKGII